MSRKRNTNFHSARREKYDEFYTMMKDVKKEVEYYKSYLKNKTVYCNCDDPKQSQFWKFFKNNFKELELKKLIATHYDSSGKAFLQPSRHYYHGDCIVSTSLKENGDFRSDECIEILKESDVVVTNPPFSLFREFIAQMFEYDKKFLIIGNMGAASFKEIFPLFKNNKLWFGISNGGKRFHVPDDYTGTTEMTDEGKVKQLGMAFWFTNIPHDKKRNFIPLHKKYNEADYPEYDNYNAINVNEVRNIPVDYGGIMGVPVSFLDKHNPSQFEIIGSDYQVKEGLLPFMLKQEWRGKTDKGYIKGKRLYSRIFIRRAK